MQRNTAFLLFLVILVLPLVGFASENRPAPVPRNKQTEVINPTVKGKVIAIDPGHGGSDPGAIGRSGLAEKNVTLAISSELRKLLEENKAKVVLTRNSDRDVHSELASDAQELQSRVDIANKSGADLFVSVHIDSFSDQSARGTTTYYAAKTTRDALFAAQVQQAMVNQLGLLNRGANESNFYVLKHTSMPAILTEVAFISNPTEEAMLSRPDFIKKAAYGIYSGIVQFFTQDP